MCIGNESSKEPEKVSTPTGDTNYPALPNTGTGTKTLEERVSDLERKDLELPVAELELPVAEIESDVSDNSGGVKLRVRLKGQRPDNKCLLEFHCNADLIETIHEAKKRGGTVWVRFKVKKVNEEGKTLEQGELVVRDILE